MLSQQKKHPINNSLHSSSNSHLSNINNPINYPRNKCYRPNSTAKGDFHSGVLTCRGST